jgi:hypothetical protein
VGIVASHADTGDKQKVMEIFRKCQKNYINAQSFEIKMQYVMYGSYTSQKPTEQYEGTYIKNRQEAYSKIGNTEFVQLRDCFIKADHETNLIMFGKRSQDDAVFYDIESLVKNFKTFEYKEKGNQIICTMGSAAVTFVPYSKMVICINKKTLTIDRQQMYMLTQMPVIGKNGRKTMSYPRVEVIFSGFKTKNIKIGEKFKKEYYVVSTRDGIVPVGQYKEFRIVD